MIPALTEAEALELIKARVDAGWLEELLSTPDGEAALYSLIDAAVAADRKSAQDTSALYIRASSRQVDEPATGAQYATTTLAVTLRRQPNVRGEAFKLPAGTRTRTPDGHVYLTDTELSWGVGERGVAKTTTATAEAPGHPGVIPPGEITEFVDRSNGLSGAGVAVTLSTIAFPNTKAIRFQTDMGQPNPFRSELVDYYLEIVDVSTLAASANVGRLVQITKMTSGGSYGSAVTPETAYAWAAPVNVTTDFRYADWYVGSHTFTWRLVDWSEYFSVENTTAVVGGREATLDELAKARGRPRIPGEGDNRVRGRLTRQPQPPVPLGTLRKCVVVLAPYAGSRLDIRIYEMGEPAPDEDVDPYAVNFPASMGFISDLHTTDMSTPETPDGMASQSPTYTTLDPFFNPGLALLEGGPQRWVIIVRWDPPGWMSSDLTAEVRKLLFAAAKDAAQGGCIVQLYGDLGQWGYS